MNRRLIIFRWPALVLMVALLISVLFQNCGQPSYQMDDAGALPRPATLLGAPTTQPIDPSQIVCDPNTTATNAQNGLVSELYYMTSNTGTNGQSVLNFYDPAKAHKSQKTLFFTQIKTIPQNFSQGFLTQNNNYVADDNGNILYEWFSLRYFTEIRVNLASEEGRYELGTLADDGIIVETLVNGQWKQILNDDGLHAVQFGCSSQVIEMKRGVSVPLRVSYYQGPATEIASMLHWRKLATGVEAGKDAECGHSARDYFFDLSTGQPLPPYQAMLTRGWKVIPAAHFFLPNQLTNPCVH